LYESIPRIVIVYVWNNSRTIRQIFIKFNSREFHRILYSPVI
jgi:hypothetical protein